MIGLFTPPSLRPLPISASYCGHSTGALKTKRNSTEPQTTMRSAASINAAMASLSAEQHSGKPRAPLGRWCGAFHRVRLRLASRGSCPRPTSRRIYAHTSFAKMRHASAFPRRVARGLHYLCPSRQRARGMPGARCIHSLARAELKWEDMASLSPKNNTQFTAAGNQRCECAFCCRQDVQKLS